MVLRAEEFDHAIGVDADRAEDRVLDRDQFQFVHARVGVVQDQVRRIDDRDLVLDAEAEDVVLGVEASVAQVRQDEGAIPDGAISEDDFFQAGRRPEEVVHHPCRVDQETVVAFELDEQVIAFADQRDVLRSQCAVEDEAVGVCGVALLLDPVLGAVEAEQVVVVARPTAQRVVAEAAIEDLGRIAAGQRVIVDRADELLDGGKPVAQRFARKAFAQREVNFDAFVGAGVIRRVEAVASVDGVRPATAAEAVVVGIAIKFVVVEGGLNDLDAVEQVALGIAATGRARFEIDDDPEAGERVVGGVDAVTAIEQVRTLSATSSR